MIGWFRCFSIKKSKKQLKESLSKSRIYSYFSEAATRGALYKKLFIKISHYSQENICVGVSLLEKRLCHICRPLAWNFIKLENLSWIFFNESWKIFILRTHFLQDSCGWLLLIFRKPDIHTFNIKQIFSQMFFIGSLYLIVM